MVVHHQSCDLLYMYIPIVYVRFINDTCTVYNIFLEQHCRLLQPVFYVNQTSTYKSDFPILTKCSTMNNEYVRFLSTYAVQLELVEII